MLIEFEWLRLWYEKKWDDKTMKIFINWDWLCVREDVSCVKLNLGMLKFLTKSCVSGRDVIKVKIFLIHRENLSGGREEIFSTYWNFIQNLYFYYY